MRAADENLWCHGEDKPKVNRQLVEHRHDALRLDIGEVRVARHDDARTYPSREASDTRLFTDRPKPLTPQSSCLLAEECLSSRANRASETEAAKTSKPLRKR